MIEIELPEDEIYVEKKNLFISVPKVTLQLEHSLLSIHKWEARTHKAFFNRNYEKTNEESLLYIKCMTIKPTKVPKFTYERLTRSDINKIFSYINDPMTATTFSGSIGSGKGGNDGSYVSAEIIYYWMITLNIPLEFEKRHINQLLTLIEVISRKNDGKSTTISPKEAAARRKLLNAQRKAKYHTRG